jgi:hypothetical protein
MDDMRVQRDLEVWKHFADMGGTDKNTMIVAVSWLLGLAAAAIGYTLTHLSESTTVEPMHTVSVLIVSALGLVLSLLAAFVTVLYAGYANRNWAQADMIARKRGWRELLPQGCAGENTERRLLARAAWRLARPCVPDRELAPVFGVFTVLAIIAIVAHAVVLIRTVSFLQALNRFERLI